MRYLLPLLALALVACSESSASRVGDNVYRIDGPGIPGGSDGPNRRLATELCPSGYRLINSESHKGGPDRATDAQETTTIWTIKCL
jgi:hypothetical protein